MDEFSEIMTGNNKSLLEVDREAYWRIRRGLDDRLRELLKSFESLYLGPFKAIFLGAIDDSSFKNACQLFSKKLLAEGSKLQLVCVDNALLDIFSESAIFCSGEELKTGARLLFKTNNQSFQSKLTNLKRSCFKSFSTKTQKDQLYEKISPVGLILDSALTQFPFENLPTFREIRQSFFRVPSLRVATKMYQTYATKLEGGVDDDGAYYLVNPSANLASTEHYFKEKLKKITRWKGTIGEEPTVQELSQCLQETSLYLYFGHGSGSIHYRKINGGLESLSMKMAAIIMGCSSGRISSEGNMESVYGMAYRFLLCGSLCYVGNLWDVTDKDIDAFSDRFMSFWCPSWQPDNTKLASLPQALACAREECRLKYLIGCAPVVFGLPINNCS